MVGAMKIEYVHLNPH